MILNQADAFISQIITIELNIENEYDEFNYLLYYTLYPDLKDNRISSYVDLLAHYLRTGKNEGRIKNRSEFYTQYPLFDYIAYIANNRDVKNQLQIRYSDNIEDISEADKEYFSIIHFFLFGQLQSRVSNNANIFNIYPNPYGYPLHLQYLDPPLLGNSDVANTYANIFNAIDTNNAYILANLDSDSNFVKKSNIGSMLYVSNTYPLRVLYSENVREISDTLYINTANIKTLKVRQPAILDGGLNVSGGALSVSSSELKFDGNANISGILTVEGIIVQSNVTNATIFVETENYLYEQNLKITGNIVVGANAQIESNIFANSYSHFYNGIQTCGYVKLRYTSENIASSTFSKFQTNSLDLAELNSSVTLNNLFVKSLRYWTVEFFIYPSSNPGFTGSLINLNTSNIKVNTSGNLVLNNTVTSAKLTANIWHHIALTYTGRYKLYFNGNLTSNITGNNIVDISTLKIGNTFSVNCNLSELRLSSISRYSNAFIVTTNSYEVDQNTIVYNSFDELDNFYGYNYILNANMSNVYISQNLITDKVIYSGTGLDINSNLIIDYNGSLYTESNVVIEDSLDVNDIANFAIGYDVNDGNLTVDSDGNFFTQGTININDLIYLTDTGNVEIDKLKINKFGNIYSDTLIESNFQSNISNLFVSNSLISNCIPQFYNGANINRGNVVITNNGNLILQKHFLSGNLYIEPSGQIVSNTSIYINDTAYFSNGINVVDGNLIVQEDGQVIINNELTVNDASEFNANVIINDYTEINNPSTNASIFPSSSLVSNNNQGYLLTASTTLNTTQIYNLFNKVYGNVSTDYWSSNTRYNSTSGDYTGTETTEDYDGEWIQIKMPQRIQLTTYQLYPYFSLYNKYSPETFVLFGSNDDINWDLIDTQENLIWTTSSKTFTINSSNYYNYYRIVTQTVGNATETTGKTSFALSEIVFTGIPYNLALNVDGDTNLTQGLFVGDSTFVVINEGYVGVGTSNPQSDFHVEGNVYITDFLNIGTTSFDYELDVIGNANISGELVIGGSLTVNDNFELNGNLLLDGFMGINKSNPTYDLDVGGNINFSGSLYQNGILFVSSGGGGGNSSNAVGSYSLYETNTNLIIGKIFNTLSLKLGTTGYQSGVALSTDGTTIALDNQGIYQLYTYLQLDTRNLTVSGNLLASIEYYKDNTWTQFKTIESTSPIITDYYTPFIYSFNFTTLGYSTQWRTKVYTSANANISVTTGSWMTVTALSASGVPFWNSGNVYTNEVYYTSGNVGIGSTIPSKTLDITGDINFTGNIYSKGVIQQFTGAYALYEGNTSTLTGNSNVYCSWKLGTSGYQSGILLSTDGTQITLNNQGVYLFNTCLNLNSSIATTGNILTILEYYQSNTWKTYKINETVPPITTNYNTPCTSSFTFATLGLALLWRVRFYTSFTGNFSVNVDNRTWLMISTMATSGVPFWRSGNVYTNEVYYTSGNVGIGTSVPSKTLDITGDINLTGNIYSNGNLFAATGSYALYESNSSVVIANSNTFYTSWKLGTSGYQSSILLSTDGTNITLYYDGVYQLNSYLNLQTTTLTYSGNLVASLQYYTGFTWNTFQTITNYIPVVSDYNAPFNINFNFITVGYSKIWRLKVFTNTTSNISVASGSWITLNTLSSQGVPFWRSGNVYSNEVYYDQGNVGIGTTTPIKTLDISGDLNLSGNIYTNGNLFATTGAFALYESNSSVITGNVSTFYSSWKLGTTGYQSSILLSTDGTQITLYTDGIYQLNTFLNLETTTLTNSGNLLASLEYFYSNSWSVFKTINNYIPVVSDFNTPFNINFNFVTIGYSKIWRLRLYTSTSTNISINTSSWLAINSVAGQGVPFWRSGQVYSNEIYFLSGNVGVGTSTPSKTLDIYGDINLTGNVYTGGNIYALLRGNVTNLFTSNANVTSILQVQGNTRLLDANGTTGIFVTNLGNVGIGIATPNANLHVIGPVNFISSTMNTGFYMRTGNVGIGTSTPTANLHVIGTSQLLGSSGITGLYVTNTGLVGINTTIPTSNLHIFTGATTITASGNVAANIGGPLTILHGSNDGFNRFISALDTNMINGSVRSVVLGQAASTNNQAEIGYFHIGSGNISNYMGMGLYGKTTLFLTGSANVGVGTTAPVAPLHVNGQTWCNGGLITSGWTAPTFLANGFGSQGAMIGWNRSGGSGEMNITNVVPSSGFRYANFEFGSYIISSATYTTYGAWNGVGIGIGTTNPTSNLHVSGTGYVTRTLTVDGITYAKGGVDFSSGASNHLGVDGGIYKFGGQVYLAADDNLYVSTTNGTVKFYFDPANGRLGINTSPSYPLHVVNSATFSGSNHTRFYLNSDLITSSIALACSAYIVGDLVVGGSICAASDKRIKTNIQLVTEGLEILCKLEPVTFDYIDNIQNKASGLSFIAQDIRKYFPKAVDLISDYIPSIYKPYTINNNTIIGDFTNELIIGQTIKCFDKENKEFIGKVININSNSLTIVFKEDYNDNIIFIYGPLVDDFHVIDSDKIFCLCITSIKELKQKNDLLEEKVNSLETENTLLKERLQRIEEYLNLILE